MVVELGHTQPAVVTHSRWVTYGERLCTEWACGKDVGIRFLLTCMQFFFFCLFCFLFFTQGLTRLKAYIRKPD